MKFKKKKKMHNVFLIDLHRNKTAVRAINISNRKRTWRLKGRWIIFERFKFKCQIHTLTHIYIYIYLQFHILFFFFFFFLLILHACQRRTKWLLNNVFDLHILALGQCLFSFAEKKNNNKSTKKKQPTTHFVEMVLKTDGSGNWKNSAVCKSQNLYASIAVGMFHFIFLEFFSFLFSSILASFHILPTTIS